MSERYNKQNDLGLFAYFRRHPLVLASLISLTLTIVGLLHDWLLLGSFGVNYFNFADVDDFLVAAGKFIDAVEQPWVLLVPIVLLLINYLFFRVSGGGHMAFIEMLILFLVLIFVVYAIYNVLVGSIDHERKQISCGEIPDSQIQLRNGNILGGEEDPSRYYFITGTNDYLFFFQKKDEDPCKKGEAIIIPTSNILSVRQEARKREPGPNFILKSLPNLRSLALEE